MPVVSLGNTLSRQAGGLSNEFRLYKTAYPPVASVIGREAASWAAFACPEGWGRI